MSVIYLGSLIFGFVGWELTEGAMNMSGSWFLPHGDFPVFYRYFAGQVTWEEAEGYCQTHHHGDLVQVQTSAQMDALRAYLEEMNINHNVWIGLKKDSPEEPFSWTNGEKLLGDGYWLEPTPKTNEKLCASVDPAYDFRWKSFYCGGPQVASYVCELPVPEWAKRDGCLISSMPSVVITFISELNVVQLFSDCGLKGTRRIACRGQTSQEDLIRKLSCQTDAPPNPTSDLNPSTTHLNTVGSTWTNSVNDIETTKMFGVDDKYLPQTRHRRDINTNTLEVGMSSTNENTNSVLNTADSVPETSTQTSFTRAKTDLLKLLSYTPSHVPPSVSDAAIPETLDEEKVEKRAEGKFVTELFSKMSTESMPTSTLSISKNLINEETTTTEVKLEKSLKIPVFIQDSSLEDKNKVSGGSSHGVPVLIITGESFNESGDSGTGTSENPRIVLMIDDKEDFPEPYLVPLGDDIVLNNPSLSPLEVIDVDLVEIDNFTTRTTISSETNPKHQTTDLTDTPTTPEIKQTTDDVGQNETSTVLLDLTTTPTPPKPTTTPVTTTTTESPKSSSTEQETFLGSDEELDMPQRPNRGRHLSHHPNHSPFYPYFLNRVWG